MQIKSQIRVTAYVVSFIWSLAVAFNGLQLSGLTSKLLTFIPIVLVLAFTAFDKYLWHVGSVPKYVKHPDLRGTWLGTFEGEWIGKDGATNQADGSAALIIKQDFTHLSIVLVAEKSKSYSYISHLREDESGEFAVSYEYGNTPKLRFRDDMPAHSGSATLTVLGPRPRRLNGEYWTNRLSRGTMDMSWVSHDIASDLAGAMALTRQNTNGRS